MSDIVKEIRETLEKATPGPWMWEDQNKLISINPLPGDEFGYVMEGSESADEETNGEIFIDVTEHDALLIANAPTWLIYQQQLIDSQGKEIERLENKYHIDMNNYRSDVQTWQEEHDRQIIKLQKTLELAIKALERIEGYWEANITVKTYARDALTSINSLEGS